MEPDEYLDLQDRSDKHHRDLNKRIGEETLDLAERTIIHLATLQNADDASFVLEAAIRAAEGNPL